MQVSIQETPSCNKVAHQDLVKYLFFKEHSHELLELGSGTVEVCGHNINVNYSSLDADEEFIDIHQFKRVDACVNIAGKNDKRKRIIEGIKMYNIAELENAEPLSVEKTEDEEMVENQLPTHETFRKVGGVGGMRREIDFVRQNLFSVKTNPSLAQQLIQLGTYNNGILFYGPPGTGKTYLAEATAKVFQLVDPDLIVRRVRGPELFNQMVGGTETAVRELFAPALESFAKHQDNPEIKLQQHLIVIDEVDSLFGKRGSDQSNSAGDRATAQFISMIDDRNLRQNLFFICTTNRIDMIDSAVLRSGRLGLHLEISAMDTEGKADILKLALERLQPYQSNS